MDGVFMRKWEVSLLFGAAVTLLWTAAADALAPQWWTTAFAPLCDTLLTAEADGGGIVLRSKLWELLMQFVF